MNREDLKKPVETSHAGTKTLPAPKPAKETKDAPAEKPRAADKE